MNKKRVDHWPPLGLLISYLDRKQDIYPWITIPTTMATMSDESAKTSMERCIIDAMWRIPAIQLHTTVLSTTSAH
jgi:hypothetical protein